MHGSRRAVSGRCQALVMLESQVATKLSRACCQWPRHAPALRIGRQGITLRIADST